MAVEYEVAIRNEEGIEQYRLTGSGHYGNVSGGFLRLEYTKEINNVGLLTFEVDASHTLVGEIGLDWQVEVRRRNLSRGLDWYTDFGGLWRAQRRTTDREGRRTWIGYCPGYLHLLTRAHILYPADTLNRTRFSNEQAETIAKMLVTHNASVTATTAFSATPKRDRNQDQWATLITVEADNAEGNSFDYRCARMNLLRALQEVSTLGDGDFDLIRIDDREWEFRWYDGQRGIDRTNELVFSMAYGNMENPDLFQDYIEYPTVAIVAGQGQEEARQIEIRTASDHESFLRASEAYVDARSYETAAGLQAHGDLWLAEQRVNRVVLNFDPVQTEAYNYGIQYQLGDVFTARYEEVEAVKQLTKVTIVVSPDSDQPETIKLVTTNV
jgi:hypothetical protein